MERLQWVIAFSVGGSDALLYCQQRHGGRRIDAEDRELARAGARLLPETAEFVVRRKGSNCGNPLARCGERIDRRDSGYSVVGEDCVDLRVLRDETGDRLLR